MIKNLIKKTVPPAFWPWIRNMIRYKAKLRSRWGYTKWIKHYDPVTGIREPLHPDFVAMGADAVTMRPDAFYQINQYLKAHPDVDLIYFDHDVIDAVGKRKDPYFKPYWDPYLLMSQDYVGPFFVVRQSLFSPEASFADLAKKTQKIGHLSKIMYHVSKHDFLAPKPLIFDLPAVVPLISILIPTKDGLEMLRPCIESIFAKTHIPFEIIIVNNNSVKAETLAYFDELKKREQVRVLDYPHPFNYSAINNFAAEQAKGEVLLLLNNDTEILKDASVEAMLSLILREDVGAVGAKLLFPDGKLQHVGMILGLGGLVGHAELGCASEGAGYFNLRNITRTVSAVTAACLMIKKLVYQRVQGLDEEHFSVAYNDTDLCLKVGALGYHVLYTPQAVLCHKESATRGYDTTPEKQARADREAAYFQQKWGRHIQDDPHYSPNLSLRAFEEYSLKN